MLIVKKIGEGVARYYLDQGPGEWLGTGAGLLGLSGPVSGPCLRAVLHGDDPRTGQALSKVRSPRRRAGWDLVFAAPKSLSLVAGSPEEVHRLIDAAQRQAVTATLSHFEKGTDRQLIAAGFSHRHNAAGEPHLHTHLLVANLCPAREGGWSALRAWFWREELAAVYHLALRAELGARGLDYQWKLRADTLADLAGVPSAAVRAASTRSHLARLAPKRAGRAAPPATDWRAATRRAGWELPGDPNELGHLLRSAAASAGVGATAAEDEQLARRVAYRLLRRGSTFNQREVLVALAATFPGGLHPPEAAAWADGFCRAALEVEACEDPTGRRWTTREALEADRRLAELISQRAETPGLRSSAGVVFSEVLGELLEADRSLGPQARLGARMLAESSGVGILSPAPGESGFLASASIAAICALSGRAAGLRVAVATEGTISAARWEALAGLGSFHPGEQPDILLIDRADRLPSGNLLSLLLAAPAAKVIFVEGGTLPRARREVSAGYRWATSDLTRIDPGAAPQWELDGESHPFGAARALSEALGVWAEHCCGQEGGLATVPAPPVMVGLGLPEVLALNRSAQRHLATLGVLRGPPLWTRGRAFLQGDRVVALAALTHGVGCGSVGSVLEADPASGRAILQWPARTQRVDRFLLARVGHAYAATPRVAGRMEGPVVLLGHSADLGIERSRVLAEVSTSRGLLLGRAGPTLASCRAEHTLVPRQVGPAPGLAL